MISHLQITIVAGARPNFMKVAPIIHEIKRQITIEKKLKYRLVHTGQHYDKTMSDTFFSELKIPKPDINLNCGGGTQAEQTAAIMVSFERELLDYPADLVIVVGDVTSTMACSIVSKKLNTKVAHIEAGIRSFDLTMPEEINRMVTDCLADYFFTTTVSAGQNLKHTGIPEERIFFVGNVMIDTLLANIKRLKKPAVWDEAYLKMYDYLVLTLHRPGNVDNEQQLKILLETISEAARDLKVIFPVHPRTSRKITKLFNNSTLTTHNLILIEPLGYLEFNYLVKNAKAVITDSGGITEETTVLGVPCITIRDNTERPETVTIGTNELIGTNPTAIKPALNKLISGNWKKGSIPDLWDGNAAKRIVDNLMRLFNV